jgi:hypothetical protein
MSTPLTTREQLVAAIDGFLVGYVVESDYGIHVLFDTDRDEIADGLAYVLLSTGVIAADQNDYLQGEVARLGADIIGHQTIISILQGKLREYEIQLNDKLAAQAQAVEVAVAHGIRTTVVPGTDLGVPTSTAPGEPQ